MTTLNGDLERRVAVATATMDWAPSPSGTVWRKRLHLVGPAESGQVTSLVRYEPNSDFPVHDHPDGEEIFVLEGVFSDDAGDWPAGTYLLNPEGFRHAPHSIPGCTLFVKLRQYPGRTRRHVALSTAEVPWQPTATAGIESKPLYAQAGFADTTRLERWAPAGSLPPMSFPEGAEIFVIDGSFEDDGERFERYGWLRLPRGAALTPTIGAGGCTVYIKEAGLCYQRAG